MFLEFRRDARQFLARILGAAQPQPAPKPSAKPAVDVVVTHAGSVPVVRPDQQGFHGEGAEPGEDVRTGEDQNGESIFNRLKKWWKAEN